MPGETTITRVREWDEMEPHAVPSHPIPLQRIAPLDAGHPTAILARQARKRILSHSGAPEGPAFAAGEAVRVRFFGTRGSIATPGPQTLRYGGNTSCIEVRSKSGT